MAVQAGNMVLVEVAVLVGDVKLAGVEAGLTYIQAVELAALVDGVKLVEVEAGLTYSQAVERAVWKVTGHVVR